MKNYYLKPARLFFNITCLHHSVTAFWELQGLKAQIIVLKSAGASWGQVKKQQEIFILAPIVNLTVYQIQL